MEEAAVTAATGALGPVIAKLGAVLSSEYKLRRQTRRDVNFIKAKLMSVHSLLWNIWGREDLDEPSKALKMEALNLADNTEDAIDDFIISLERRGSSMLFIQTKMKASPFEDLKKRVGDVSERCRGKWKKSTSLISSLFSRKQATPAAKPRDHPFIRKDASELVDIVKPRDKLVEHLIGEDESAPVQLQLKMAAIVGMAGIGKTTLADLVYQVIRDKFQSRAFVSVSPGGNIREVLARILEQLGVACTHAATEEEHLIDIISNYLKDKRYLVIIDDIWHGGEWEFIRKYFPENNLGSRIVMTTRNYSIATKWDEVVNTFLYKMEPLDKQDAADRMKRDMVGEDFDSRHPAVSMCGGLPLALVCMFSALANARDHQEQQGLCVHTPDLQNSIEEQVKRNGVQNTPGFEPLVESMQLGYDDLPHHMLKTCLLYCSMYPEGHKMLKSAIVTRWMAEGFVYEMNAAEDYFDELVNMGFILMTKVETYGKPIYWMHPMMRTFLRWKSWEDHLFTCSSEITFSYGSWRIRRLCIDSDLNDPLSELDWSRIRSLIVVDGSMKTVPLEKMDHLRVLDVVDGGKLYNHHLKDICCVVCPGLRHLLGLYGERITEIPPEIGRLRRLQTLEVRETYITELPGEIGYLQQLETLVMSENFWLNGLPSQIGDLQQLKTLDLASSRILELPKEIGKLKQLEQLILSRTPLKKIPREIGGLEELKILKLSYCKATLPFELWYLTKLVELPECIGRAWNKSDVMSSLASEILSFQTISGTEAGLVVGAKQMHIPPWIKEHYNGLSLLDIRICELEEDGLKVLREMPHLQDLRLRFEVVPTKPISISSEGFATLKNLMIDSRVPRVYFQEGAMPMLEIVEFQFQFYGGTQIKEPLGFKHLVSLREVAFRCNDWYGAGNPCISATIDLARKEAQELAQTRVDALENEGNIRAEEYIYFNVSGHESDFIRVVSEEYHDACSSLTEEMDMYEAWQYWKLPLPNIDDLL